MKRDDCEQPGEGEPERASEQASPGRVEQAQPGTEGEEAPRRLGERRARRPEQGSADDCSDEAREGDPGGVVSEELRSDPRAGQRPDAEPDQRERLRDHSPPSPCTAKIAIQAMRSTSVTLTRHER